MPGAASNSESGERVLAALVYILHIEPGRDPAVIASERKESGADSPDRVLALSGSRVVGEHLDVLDAGELGLAVEGLGLEQWPDLRAREDPGHRVFAFEPVALLKAAL